MTDEDVATGPGFHRRISLFPAPGRIVAGLEDNLHRFEIRLSHAGGVVTDIEARSLRYPLTTCPGAPAFLREQAIGQRLDALAGLNILQHCTHLLELAILCACHALDGGATQLDLHVSEATLEGVVISLATNGRPTLALRAKDRRVETPGPWFGRDLSRAAEWRGELDPLSSEQAMLIARALTVSVSRTFPPLPRAIDYGDRAAGVCFSFQEPRVRDGIRIPGSRKDFPTGARPPLPDFDPALGFGAS